MPTHERVILNPTTSATTSDAFEVDRRRYTVFAYGALTLSAEYSDLQRQDPDGSWQNVYDAAGQIRLHAGRPGVDITGGGRYRINKAGSAGNIGAAIVPGPV